MKVSENSSNLLNFFIKNNNLYQYYVLNSLKKKYIYIIFIK
jgi:hypothetical protein